MKKRIAILIVTSIFICINLFAQKEKEITINVSDINHLTLTNIKEFSRYENPDNPLIITCGYYDQKDSCFYQCDGNLICKAQKKFIRDGKGCCQSRIISFYGGYGGKLDDFVRQTDLSLKNYSFISQKGTTLTLKAPDQTMFSVEVKDKKGLDLPELGENEKYSFKIISQSAKE